jgi:hypothetical protein
MTTIRKGKKAMTDYFRSNRQRGFLYLSKNVDILGRPGFVLRCTSCGTIWSPNIKPSGRLPCCYWKCPRGCKRRGAGKS